MLGKMLQRPFLPQLPTLIQGSWVKGPGRKKQRVVGKRVTDSGLKVDPPGAGALRLTQGTKRAERAPPLRPPPARQPAGRRTVVPPSLPSEAPRGDERKQS